MDTNTKASAWKLLGVGVLAAAASFLLLKAGKADEPQHDVAQDGPAERKSRPSPRRTSLPWQPEEPLGKSVDPASLESTLHPRDTREWQGMLVDLSMQALCDGSTSCGLAMACLPSKKCGPCQRDRDCGNGERCALDHCVLAENVQCTSRSECASGELCVLSGYTPDPRGNAEMKASCLGAMGGKAQEEKDLEVEGPAAEPEPTPFEPDSMREDIQKLLERTPEQHP